MLNQKSYRLLRLSLAAALLLALPLPALLGQSAGARLEGIAKDASQAVVPGVTVTATNEGTNISTTSVTNDTGFYVFVNLPPGPYTVTAELQGFKRFVNKNVVLMVGDARTFNVTLETGEINTEVVVSAAAPLIDMTSGKIGAVVQERQVVDLPLNGRNPLDLFKLQAGASVLGGGSVDGLRTNSNNMKIDGVFASDASYDSAPTSTFAVAPLDAIAEYRVTTSSATADSGRGSGAQISAVYRSGTNNFHGSAYEYNRNQAYNANDWFPNRQGQTRPKFQRNQYGASLGGPIIKNKTFFFGTWEGQREVRGSVNNRNVYTQNVRDGIFRYNPAKANSSSDVDPVTMQPKVPYKEINLLTVDPTRQGFDSSGIVGGMMKLFPKPNNLDLGDGFNVAGYQYISSNPNHYNQTVIKVDHTLTRTNQLSIAMGGYWSKPGYDMMFSGYRSEEDIAWRRNIAIGLVSALKPTITNELRVGAYKRYTLNGNPDPECFNPKGNYQLVGIWSSGSRGAAPEGNIRPIWLPQRNPIDAFNVNDNVSWVKKNHTFKWGVDIIFTTKNNWFGGDEYIPAIYTANANNPANVPSLTGLNSSDRSRAAQLVNDMTGTIGYINQTYNANSMKLGFTPYDTRHRLLRTLEPGAFFSDTWKVAQNLTISYGTRWDLLPPGWMKNGIYSYPKGGATTVLGMTGAAGYTFGRPVTSATYATDFAPNQGKDIVEWDWNNFGPNLGFTWDPFKDGKTSISANYRVSYDRMMQSVYSRLDDQNQGLSIDLQATPMTRFSDPNIYQAVAGKAAILPLPVGKVFEPLPMTRQGSALALANTIKTPYTQSWSLRIQREVVKDWTVQMAYVGNINVGGFRGINYNQMEIMSNGFFQGFLAAQRNLAANGNPNKGESIGVLANLYKPLGGIPSSQNSYVQQGQVAYLANYLDTTTACNGTRGGCVGLAGLPANFFGMNPQVANANVIDNLSNSTWHGMKLEIGKRFSAGTYFQFAYTLGKGLTDYVGGQTQVDAFRDNYNRKLDKTLQNYDSTHNIAANGIWELPFGTNKRWLNGMGGWKEAIIGGWQLNAIFQLATSRPFTIQGNRYNLTYGDYSTAMYNGTADFNFASKVIKGASQVRAITTEEAALFSFAPAGSAGDVPQRAFRGPMFSNIDASMFKNFKLSFLGEQGSLQFRAEAFNLLNHPSFSAPNGRIDQGTFGVISSTISTARVLQFALKLSF